MRHPHYRLRVVVVAVESDAAAAAVAVGDGCLIIAPTLKQASGKERGQKRASLPVMHAREQACRCVGE